MNPGRSRKKFPRVLATSVAALLGLAIAAQADPATWTGLGGDSLWTNNGNWTAPYPGSTVVTTDTATFDGASPFDPTIQDTTITIGEVIFTAAAVTPYTITLNAATATTSLTFDVTGVSNSSAATHLFTTGSGGQPASFIFNNSAGAGSNVSWTINTNGTMVFNS